MSSFAAKLLHEDSDKLVFLITGKQNNDPVWCYALITERMRSAFNTALHAGKIKVSDFGKILFSGQGHIPPSDIQNIISSYYAD